MKSVLLLKDSGWKENALFKRKKRPKTWEVVEEILRHSHYEAGQDYLNPCLSTPLSPPILQGQKKKKKTVWLMFPARLPISFSVCHMHSVHWTFSFSAHRQYENRSILATDFSQWNPLYSAVFSSNNKMAQECHYLCKDFQYSPVPTAAFLSPSIQIIVNKHLLHEAYSPRCRNHRHGLASYRKRQRSPEMLGVCWVLRQRCRRPRRGRHRWALLDSAKSGSAENFSADETLDSSLEAWFRWGSV